MPLGVVVEASAGDTQKLGRNAHATPNLVPA